MFYSVCEKSHTCQIIALDTSILIFPVFWILSWSDYIENGKAYSKNMYFWLFLWLGEFGVYLFVDLITLNSIKYGLLMFKKETNTVSVLSCTQMDH